MLRRRHALQEVHRLRDARLQLGEARLVVVELRRLDAGQPRDTELGRVAGDLHLRRNGSMSGASRVLEQHLRDRTSSPRHGPRPCRASSPGCSSMLTKIGTLAEYIEIVIAVLLRDRKARCYSARRQRAQSVRRACAEARRGLVNIIILDDYQDAVRKLQLRRQARTPQRQGLHQHRQGHRPALGAAARRRRARADPRTHALPAAAAREAAEAEADRADRPRRRRTSTSQACTRTGIAVAEGVGSPVAPAELTWALIMAAMRRLPQYIGNLKHGALAAVGPEVGVDAAQLRRSAWCSRAARSASGATARSASWSPATARRSACRSRCGAARPRASRRRTTACRPRRAARSFFEACDVLSLHLRLTDETRGIVTLRRPGAHEADGAAGQHLARRADRGRRARLRAQPRPARHGRRRRVRERADPAGPSAAAPGERICTPHIGYVELDSYEMYFGAAFDNVVNFIKGTPTQHRQPRRAARCCADGAVGRSPRGRHAGRSRPCRADALGAAVRQLRHRHRRDGGRRAPSTTSARSLAGLGRGRPAS